MQAIDHNGDLLPFLMDPSRRVPRAHLESVCKIRKGPETCKYLSLGPRGYSCAKRTPVRVTLDGLAKHPNWAAKGDNCDGLGEDGDVTSCG